MKCDNCGEMIEKGLTVDSFDGELAVCSKCLNTNREVKREMREQDERYNIKRGEWLE